MDFPTYDTLALSWPMPQVLQVTLNRPEVGNALNTQMAHDMLDLWRRLEADGQDVRCVVLTGAGDRIFCGGGDLKERNGMTRDAWNRQHELFERMYWQMGDLPQPLIGAINGHTYAGGLEMLLMCDFAYASDHARFAFTEVAIGIMPGAGGTQRLPRFIGKAKAMDLILTGRMMDAAEAERAGLVARVVAPEKLLEDALAAAGKIAGYSHPILMMAKETVNRAQEVSLTEGARFERRLFLSMFATEDQKEGMKAFIEKRKPAFRNR